MKNNSIAKATASASPVPNWVRWFLAPLVITTIALGWWFPYIGFLVPVAMLSGMIGGVFKGRFVCGNLCPRGAFFDNFFGWTRRANHIPLWLRLIPLRLVIMTLLMGFMIFNLSRDIGNPAHWGHVFWLMCTVTTGIGLLLMVFIHPRAWCTICPVGTMGNLAGRSKAGPALDAARCVECGLCEKQCRMGLKILDFRQAGAVTHGDCLDCGACVDACPTGALKRRPLNRT